jgi:hypothetical protein
MREGYPDSKELEIIEKWETHDVFGLFDFIESIWAYSDWGYVKKWGKDHIHNDHCLFIELHTAGWSGNESIIEALQKNQYLMMMFYSKWERGGHFYFEIVPTSLGYKKISEMAKEVGITRQGIHKTKDKFEWLHISKRINLIRLKS